MKILILFILSQNAFSWDTSFKTDLNHSTTSNVNSSNTSIEKDSYNTITGTLQTKNEFHKFKFKLRSEKYQKTSSNDNYYGGLSYSYKANKSSDYSIEAFKQKYITIPTLITDVTSDNIGFKVSSTFTKNFTQDKNGYVSLLGTYKNYVNIPTRQDSILDATFGFENYFTPSFSITPELNLEINKSRDTYYSNFNIGPSISANITASEEFELFFNAFLTYTTYGNRTFQTTVKNRTITNKEHQSLFTSEIGAIYTLFSKFPLQVKYSANKNSSNNSSSAYRSNIFSFNIGYKF